MTSSGDGEQLILCSPLFNPNIPTRVPNLLYSPNGGSNLDWKGIGGTFFHTGCGDVAMSDNGTAIAIAAQAPYQVYFSNNYSQIAQWENSTAQPKNPNRAVSVSLDGRVWIVVGDKGLFRSSDFGVTWDQLNSTLSFKSVSCSFDCSTLYALAGDYLYKSTDGGKSLYVLYQFDLPTSVFTSRDANRVVVALRSADLTVPLYNDIYISTDSGISFNVIPGPQFDPTPQGSLLTNYPVSVSGSANCDRLFVSYYYGDVWESYKLVF